MKIETTECNRLYSIIVDGECNCYVSKRNSVYAASDSYDGDLFIDSNYIDEAIDVLENSKLDTYFRIASNRIAVIRKFNDVSVEIHTIYDAGELADEVDVFTESLPVIASVWKSLRDE